MISTHSLFENKINQVKDIWDLMRPIKYENTTKNYIIKTPTEVLKSKRAICYDQVELERQEFKKIKYKFKTFFFYDPDPNTYLPTHTVLIFKENNKYFWFENSWGKYRGVHGPYSSYNSACNFIASKLKLDQQLKTVKIIEYQEFNYRGLSIREFQKAIHIGRLK